ncbi:beta-ketoacyl-ACP synthase 3 [Actinomadura sp. DC4]|uniref:beta-ketoacyl-ACP synthase 3 n=1 Tax=Actinomadura sp. DC4 TaxID=3055069 RepID=UPI0025AFA7A8|nr:beta-ketoacyl-ACP synthase 3 [Actinomadura sp. DC4]MDN3355652.1 beta-ketoacyl-ACP synthase 3 [Actinomadura sp. DC4]
MTAGARLAGVAGYRPRRVVSNQEIAKRFGVTGAWIERRLGVRRRRFAGPGESVVEMAAAAAAKALAAAGEPAARVDLVILATCSAPSPMPSIASQVAARLGVPGAGAFDVNAACAGFSYALGAADGLIRSGLSRCALVIGAERMTDWVDPDDVDTATVFADGAGAAVVTPATQAAIHPVVWGGDGSRSGLLGIADRYATIRMDGPAVYRWATTEMPPVAEAACRAAGLTTSDLKGFVSHQANLRMINRLAAALGVTGIAVADDIIASGNTSAASIPLGLARLIDLGRVRSGDPVLLLGFGAGLSYAAQVIDCP